MSWTKPKVEPEKRQWITKTVIKLGRTPNMSEESEGDNPRFMPLMDFEEQSNDSDSVDIKGQEGSSSGTSSTYRGEGEGSSSATKPTSDELMDALGGSQENVKRQKTFGGVSRDQGYEDNIKKPVQEFLDKNRDVFADGNQEPLTREQMLDALTLRKSLTGAGQGYDKRSKGLLVSSKMRKQRERKSDAVDSRVDALDQLTGCSPKGLAQSLIPANSDKPSRLGSANFK